MNKKKVLSIVLAIALVMELILILPLNVVNAAFGSSDFLKTSGKFIKNNYGTGATVQLCGTNLGGWLLMEGWMAPLGKPALSRTGWVVTASVGANPGYAIDGDINTRWTTGVPQASGQWFKVDMAATKTFDQICLNPGQWTSEEPVNYKVEVSNDGSYWWTVSTVVEETPTTRLTLILSDATTARYILITLTGSSSNAWTIAELNVNMTDEYNAHTVLYNRFGVTSTDNMYENYRATWLTTSDLDNIHNMGMNLVRVPIYWQVLMNSDGTWKSSAWTKLDWLVTNCASRNIYVLLDFHGAPGGSAPWASCGQAGPNPNGLWTSTANQDRTVAIWQGIATHFKDNPTVAAYGLLNEPVLGFPESPAQKTQKYDFYNRIYNAVRAIDPDHICIMEEFAGLSSAYPPSQYGWTNVVYEKHYYDMGNRLDWFAQNTLITNAINELNYYQGQWNIPFFVGEYSLYFFNDLWGKWMSGLNSINVGWTNWTYKVRGTITTSGGGNWGFYNSNTNDVPDINNDSAATIESKWSMFSTNYFQTNTDLINVVSQYTNGSIANATYGLNKTGWTATASSTEPGGSPVNALDYNYNTRWSTGAAQTNGQWFQVNLGSQIAFTQLSIEAGTGSTDYPNGYQVQVSNDAINWTTVASGIGFGQKMVILLGSQNAQYVKIVQTGSSTSWWSIKELNLYGTQLTPIIQTGLPYQNTNLTADQRADDLLSRMTLDEKIGQMLQVERVNSSTDDVKSSMIGSVLSGGGSNPTPNTPKAWADTVDSYQNAALQTRLQIPILYGVDAVHGHNNVSSATMFPHNIGLGATRDADLMQRIGSATAKEVRTTGISWDFTPVIAAPQDDRWGRAYEGFSESPDLVSQMGVPFVKGLQGLTTDASFLKGQKVVATIKHWVADGNTANGDDQGNSTMTDDDLKPFIQPYTDAIAAGAKSVMVHLGSINNVLTHSDYHLITEVLKGTNGFSGIVVSDWNGVNRLNADYSIALKTGINAGIDLCMEPDSWKSKDFIGTLRNLVNTSQVTQARVDDAVRRILKVKIQAGLFENPYTDRSLLSGGTFGGTENRNIAREAVRKSATLLKNENHILPLSKTAKVFVAGVKANDIGYQSGGWTITWQGQTGLYSTPGTTILDGIKSAASNPANVTYSKTGTGAAGNDVAIVVVGENPYAEMFGDVGTGQPIANLDLSSGWSEADQNVLDTVKTSGVPTIVIMQSGRPMNIASRLPDWKAFVEAWLPGTEGNGLADVLFGDYDFTGKLPVTWPSSFSGSAIKVNRGDSNYRPLFPYGYGLNTTATHTNELPGLIEAENYTVASGVQCEAVSDLNGGLDEGWIDTGDWMDYRVNVPATGTYKVRLRVASPTGPTGAIQLKNGTTVLATYNVPNTGGWQNWTTISQDVTLSAGVQTLRVYAVAGGWNINSIEFVTTVATSGNLLTNYGLETGNLTGWTTWNNGTNAASVDTDTPYNGTNKLTYWAASNYQQLVCQTKTVSNGSYRFSAWVRSGGGQRSLHLYAKNYGGAERIAEIGSNETGWTKYTIDGIKVTNGTIEVGAWADAFANNWTAFDNFELVLTNELSNSGFETGNTSGWTESHTGALSQIVDTDNPYVGSYKLKHTGSSSYTQTTSQLVTVPNGTYNYSVWIRSGGGQNSLELYAKNYGGADLNTSVGTSAVVNWTKYSINNIVVTNGQIEVSVTSNANAGNWAAFDNMELTKQ